MYKTVGNYIEEVQQEYNRGIRSDDTRLGNRLVYTHLIGMRATLLTQKANKNQELGSQVNQILPGIEMMDAPAHLVTSLPSLGTTYLRSKEPLPTIVTSMNQPLILSVSNIEGSVMYDKSDWSTLKNLKGNKFSQNKLRYFILDNHIWINSKKKPEVLTVRAIFEDPILASVFPVFGVCEPSCESYLDKRLYIDEDTGNVLVRMVSDKLIAKFAERQADTTNDGADSTN